MGTGPRPIDSPTRVVLDTSVVVSALVFEAGRLAWLRSAWRRERIKPLVSKSTVTELLRVLAYPKIQAFAGRAGNTSGRLPAVLRIGNRVRARETRAALS